MRVYLETSSLIKLYIQEDESEDVSDLFEAYVQGRIELCTSSITILS